MDIWNKLLIRYPAKKFSKGQMIICQDADPECCFIIRHGFVKAYFITNDGTEKLVSFEGRDDIFPVDWIFGHAREVRHFYQAYSNCEIHAVPRQEFLATIRTNPKLFERMFHYLIKRTQDYHDHIGSLEQAKAADKLICALHLLTRRFGKKLSQGTSRISLPLTQQDLANFLGLTRETTGAQLKALERHGILRYWRQNYEVHTDKLASMLENR